MSCVHFYDAACAGRREVTVMGRQFTHYESVNFWSLRKNLISSGKNLISLGNNLIIHTHPAWGQKSSNLMVRYLRGFWRKS